MKLLPSIKTVLRVGKNTLANALFPKQCIGCGAYGRWLCSSCLRAIPLHVEQQCPVCRKTNTPAGEPCFTCRSQTDLDIVFVAAPFQGSLLSNAIHVCKYEFVAEIATPLGKMLGTAVSRFDIPMPDMIIPVPLHKWRYRWRGFNQSALLASELSRTISITDTIPVSETILIRKRFTLPQAKTANASERRSNLSGAFSLGKTASRNHIAGNTIWLVDDVMTTGSTLEECARILKQAGAKKICGVVLAR